MKRDGKRAFLAVLLPMLILLAMAFGTWRSLGGVEEDVALEDMRQVEDSVRRASLACYAAEGFYPPDLAYIEEHYGVKPDETRYKVIYEVFAQNIMPQITVLAK